MENLTNVSSNEALQNLSAVYNSGTANLTNLNLSGTLTVGNTVIAQNGIISGGPITANSEIISNKQITANGPINMGTNSGLYSTQAINSGGGIFIDGSFGNTHFVGGSAANTWNIYDSNNLPILNVPNKSGTFNGNNCGVYMYNGGGSMISVTASMQDMNTGGGSATDDLWIIYPGYNITLYNQTNYIGQQSVPLDNTNGTSVAVYSGNLGLWNNVPGVIQIKQTNGSIYNVNNTRSVRVYFRGTEIIAPGLSNK
jgi:hypothetical protein